MKLLPIIFTLAFIFATSTVNAQSEVERLVEEGIQYHDQGDFDKAIETYKKALKIEPKSPLAHYELTLSYFHMKDYKNTIKHADIVLGQKIDFYTVPAYLTKGSALDMQGKTQESIKLFKKAIKKTGGHHLLYYNLALDYFNIRELENAEEFAIKAIEKKSNHPSSHFLLAIIHNQWNNPVQTLMACHYFLLLEPGSQRSESAYDMLKDNFGGNVTREGNNTINIMISEDAESPFWTAELMISMLEASGTLEENKDKSADELFIQHTTSFFSVLGELENKGKEDVWWSFYVPFFDKLAKSDHMEAYCRWITQSQNDGWENWLAENEEKLNEFEKWLNAPE